jgi:hypothetical protein
VVKVCNKYSKGINIVSFCTKTYGRRGVVATYEQGQWKEFFQELLEEELVCGIIS